MGTWISKYPSGISIEHLTFSDNVPKQTTSLMRFHLYFTVRRIMQKLKTLLETKIKILMNKYNANFLKDHTLKWTWYKMVRYKNEHLGQDVVGFSKNPKTYGPGFHLFRDVQSYYKKFIPKISDGLTIKGTELLNQSIEAYIYSLPEAQAKTRQSIHGNRASVLETENLFCRNVEGSITNYFTSVWIKNVNKAVSDTNVVPNLAVIPSLWLLPSSVVILKNPIDKYNNKLSIASENMKFGVNPKVHFVGVKNNPPKKVHQENHPTSHLQTLDNTVVKKEEKPTSHADKSHSDNKYSDKDKPIKNDEHNTDLVATSAVSVITAYLITKYII